MEKLNDSAPPPSLPEPGYVRIFPDKKFQQYVARLDIYYSYARKYMYMYEVLGVCFWAHRCHGGSSAEWVHQSPEQEISHVYEEEHSHKNEEVPHLEGLQTQHKIMSLSISTAYTQHLSDFITNLFLKLWVCVDSVHLPGLGKKGPKGQSKSNR